MGWPIDRPTGLTHHDPARSCKGYTLMCGLGGQDAVLLDMQGRVVHRWHVPDRRLFNVELLPSGNLLALLSPLNPPPPRTIGETTRFNLDPGEPPDTFNFLGGHGDGLHELDWEGNSVWAVENPALHHDFARMANGHTMTLEWVEIPDEVSERIPGGGHLPNQPMPPRMIGDDFVELDEHGAELSRIHLWEALEPELTPICPLENRWEWTHTNSVDVMEDGGIIFSARNVSTIGIVDPPSGDQAPTLRWSCGPPELAHQHHASALANGRILVYDNGQHRLQDLCYSRVLEIDPADDSVEQVFQGTPREQFFSAHISGVCRLENGNTLVTEGAAGRIFEVDGQGQVVWEWVSPFQVQQRGDTCNWVFRAWRYGADFPGLAGRELDHRAQAGFNRLYGLGE